MKTPNTFGIIFFIRKSKSKSPEAKAHVYAKITVNGENTELSLKEEVDPKSWNGKKGMANGKSEDIRMLNTHLAQVRSGIVECYRELKLSHKLITATIVKNHFLGIEEEEHTLLKVFEYHNSEMKQELEPGTQKNYFTTKRYVENFLKQKLRTSDIYLSELNYKFITDFEKFVKENPLDHQKPCTQNGTMKHIERLKKVINLASKNEWIERDPFQKYSAHYIKKDRGFLTGYELESIENKSFTIERLQLVKDLFVFSCYTGLAYIDVMRLSHKDLRRGIDGGYWIFSARKKNRNKTEETVKIPLLPKALQIVEKYKYDSKKLNNEGLFPRISNQNLNAYLKEIADVCYIEKNLTFHLARHTFATTVTLTNKVPIETVSKLLGHASLKTTQIYARVVEAKVSDDIRELQQKLNKNTTKNTGTI